MTTTINYSSIKYRVMIMAAIDLIVLGMIKKKPQSAYELQKNIEYRNISRWVKISTPSIYKKVIKLEEKGYLISETQKNGKMPEKTIYSLTKSGEEKFLSLMEENADKVVNIFLDFNAVIMNMDLVSDDLKDILLDKIELRLDDLKNILELNRQEKQNIPIIGKNILQQQYDIAIILREWIEKFKKEYRGDKHE